jgi:DnaJ family protein A protein 2
LEDLYNGVEVSLTTEKSIICHECKGSGCSEGKTAQTCSQCKVQGRQANVVHLGSIVTQQVVTCKKCQGTGQMITSQNRCKECRGTKVCSQEKTLSVHIERGMEDNKNIVFQGEADEAPGCEPGDLIVYIREMKHKTFVSWYDNLLLKKRINFSQSLLGTSFVVKHLD